MYLTRKFVLHVVTVGLESSALSDDSLLPRLLPPSSETSASLSPSQLVSEFRSLASESQVGEATGGPDNTGLVFIFRPTLTVRDIEGLTENAGHEIAGHENTGHEFARHDKYRMKMDYITLVCAFLLNFKSFVCKTSVLTYKKT